MYRNWGREKREETCTAKFEEGGELEDGREGLRDGDVQKGLGLHDLRLAAGHGARYHLVVHTSTQGTRMHPTST